jgi:hypothetical protein
MFGLAVTMRGMAFILSGFYGTSAKKFLALYAGTPISLEQTFRNALPQQEARRSYRL